MRARDVGRRADSLTEVWLMKIKRGGTGNEKNRRERERKNSMHAVTAARDVDATACDKVVVRTSHLTTAEAGHFVNE